MKNNMDRYLATFFTFLVGVSAVMVLIVLMNFSFSWLWWGSLALSLVWTIGLGTWVWNGFDKIDIGWKGQLLYLAQRMNYVLDEGWRWAPFPFGIKKADCRQTVVKLDTLEKIITNDKVQVDIEGSIIRQIINLNKYFDVEESGIKQGLDHIWDATIREKVADKDLANVLKMHADLAEKAKKAMGTKASKSWGIKILRVVIASIKPDPKVAEDLALNERENLQQIGQVTEAKHSASLVILFEKPKTEGGAGMTHGEAVEMSQLITGKANPKNLTGFTFSPEILVAVAKVLEGRK